MKQKALPAVIGVLLVFLLASGAEAEWMQGMIWNRAAITGHSVAFSPDGRLIAATMGFGKIGLFRVSDGSLIRTLEGHTGWVTSVSFSPDGSMIASGGPDGLALWRIGPEIFVRIEVSPDTAIVEIGKQLELSCKGYNSEGST